MKQTCVSYSFEQEFLESLLSGAEKIEVWETEVEFWNEIVDKLSGDNLWCILTMVKDYTSVNRGRSPGLFYFKFK